MRGIGILILVVLFFWLCWPAISRWLKRKAMERADSYLRKAMGMPPREKKSGRRAGGDRYSSEEDFHDTDRFYRQRGYGRRRGDEPLIPKEYAEDVDFEETISQSENKEIKPESMTQSYHESQVSDVEYTEVKSSSSAKK